MHNVTPLVATATNGGFIFQQPYSLYLGVNKMSDNTDTELGTGAINQLAIEYENILDIEENEVLQNS